ncbi:MAG: TetR/AcrR family transcriptional regulator [Actinomycetota bacterium]
MDRANTSPQERRAERTRARIHVAALELFVSKGYDATTVAEIADAADISERTLFRYFRAKEDIIFDRPERFIGAAQDLIAGLDSNVSDWQAVRLALREFAGIMEAEQETVRQSSGLMLTVPELGARGTLMEHHWSEGLARGLARRRGEAQPSLDDLALASAGMALFGAAARRWVHDGRLTMPEITDETFRRFRERISTTS